MRKPVGLRFRVVSGCEMFSVLGDAFRCKREAKYLVEYVPVAKVPIATLLLVCGHHRTQLDRLAQRDDRAAKRAKKKGEGS